MTNHPISKKLYVQIRTPDQRLRVFVSSTLKELQAERKAVHKAITNLRLSPIMFESGARPHPAQELYQAYLSQSHVFIGIYWQSYGWVGPDMDISGLEDEYNRSLGIPHLIYIKEPAPDRDASLKKLLERVREENVSSYKHFTTPSELGKLVENDLILLLSEYFETATIATKPMASSPPAAYLPVPRNPLIGRDDELQAVCTLLLHHEVALVTLTGPAGIGKSRLGIHVALQLQTHFPDGVFLVALEAIRDPGLVIPTIAKTLGINESMSDIPLIDNLKGVLCSKRVLLLLDNFEQVLPAAPQISELLEACPQVKILVTSRALLHLRSEQEFPVPPLSLPPLIEQSGLELLSQYSAAELFIQRCQSVKANFQENAENFRIISEICHRLDGLPLAIELAAARIKLLPPRLLLLRLEHRFEVLRGGTKDLPERHQTLYDAIDWSYNLLDTDEQQLFQRLSVFNGGWTVEDALAVLVDEKNPQIRIIDGLEILVDNNLVWPPEDTPGGLRMRMLESIREFASSQLDKSGESDEFFLRHASHYASLAEQAEREKFGSETQQLWRTRLETELDNLRAAMSWALENNYVEYELRIATALWRFWWNHGFWREGIQWLERGLESSATYPTSVRAKALTRIGWLLHKTGNNPLAVGSLEEAILLWRQINDRPGLALALSNLGGIMMAVDNDKGIAMLEQALEIRRSLSDQHGVYATLMNLGLFMAQRGQCERAVELFTESLTMAKAVDDDYSAVITLVNLGDTFINLGEYEKAEPCFIQAGSIYQNLGDHSGVADAIRGRGRLALQVGNPDLAYELLSEACSISFDLHLLPQTIVALEGIAFAYQQLDDSLKATRILSASQVFRTQNKLNRLRVHQVDCDAYLAKLRATLNKAAFESAWKEGSNMSLEQAVKYATQRRE